MWPPPLPAHNRQRGAGHVQEAENVGIVNQARFGVGRFSIAPSMPKPALLTSTSSLPNRATVAATAARQSSSRVTSSRTASRLGWSPKRSVRLGIARGGDDAVALGQNGLDQLGSEALDAPVMNQIACSPDFALPTGPVGWPDFRSRARISAVEIPSSCLAPHNRRRF